MDAHHKLDEAGQRQEEKDGGKGHMVGEVDSFALIPFKLNLAIAGTVHALPVAGAIGVAASLVAKAGVHLAPNGG